MLDKNEVLKALSKAKDPDGEHDLLTSGQVKTVNIYKDGVQVILSPKDPTPERLKKIQAEVEEQLSKLQDHGIIKVDFTPVQEQQRRAPSSIKHAIAFASGKGGVGKSTVSIYTSLSLSKKGYKVGLLDADIYGASAHLMLGSKAKLEVKEKEKLLVPPLVHGIKLMSMGYFTNIESPVIWRGPLVGKAVRDFIDMTEWGELDYLVTDLPPGTGDAPLTLAQSLKVDGIILVTTPQEAATNVAAKSFFMFRRLGIPVIGMIENMSYYVCRSCGAKAELFGRSEGEKVAERLGIPLLGKLPLVPELAYSADSGEPLKDDVSSLLTSFDSIAEKIVKLVQKEESHAQL